MDVLGDLLDAAVDKFLVARGEDGEEDPALVGPEGVILSSFSGSLHPGIIINCLYIHPC